MTVTSTLEATRWTAVVWRLCLRRHRRHYVPFLTISGNRTGSLTTLVVWLDGDVSGQSSDIVYGPTGYSGSREAGLQAGSALACRRGEMSSQELPPSLRVSLRHRS